MAGTCPLQKCPFHGDLDPIFGSTWAKLSTKTASRSVQPFLHSSPVCSPTQTDRQTNRHVQTTLHATHVAIGRIYAVRAGYVTYKYRCIQEVNKCLIFLSVLFSSLAVLDPRVGHTMGVLSPLISALCHYDWLLHVLMLFIQAVRGLSRLCAPGIVPCIISLTMQLPSSWCDHSTLYIYLLNTHNVQHRTHKNT